MTWLVSYIIAGFVAASQTFSPSVSLTSANVPAAESEVVVSRVQNPDETESFESTYPLNPGGKVSISNVNGSITIEAWDRSEVKVNATKTADSRERLEEVKIEIDAEPDHLRIETHFLPWNRRNQSNKNQKLEVAYRLMVPRGAVLDEVEAVNGSISISGVSNVTKVSAVNGTVKAVNLRGTASLSTVNGTVTAEFESLDKSNRIDLSTVNGRAFLVIPSDSNATIKAESVNGQITNDFGLPVVKGKYVGRDLYGKVGNGTVRIFLDSVNGPLTISRKQDGKTLNPATNLLPAKSDDNPDEDMDMDVTVDVDVEAKAGTSSGQGESHNKDCKKPENDCDKVVSGSVTTSRTPRAVSRTRTSRSIGGGVSRATPAPYPNPAPYPAYPAPAEAPMVAPVPSVSSVPPVPSVPSVATTVNPQGQVVLATTVELSAMKKSLEELIKKNNELIAKNLTEIDAKKLDESTLRALEAQNRALESANRAMKGRIDAFKNLSLTTQNYTPYGAYYTYSYGGIISAPATQTVTNSFTTKDKPKVVVNALDTAVFIRGWDKNEVKFTLNRVARGNSNSTPDYLAKQDGSTINITVKPGQSDQLGYMTGKNQVRSRIEIFVPRKADLKINTAREMRVEGVNGKIELTGSEEAINVRDSGGELMASSDCGAIRVIGFDGAVKSVTNSGLISLEGNFEDLHATTSDGKIILTLPDDANVNIESNLKDIEADGFELEEIADKSDFTVWKVGNGGTVHGLYTYKNGQIFVRSAGKLTAEK